SRWLAGLVRERYGASASHFDLAVDHEIYRADGAGERDGSVLFYARATTPRRAVPLGLLALEELARRRPGVPLALFGEPGPVGARRGAGRGRAARGARGLDSTVWTRPASPSWCRPTVTLRP